MSKKFKQPKPKCTLKAIDKLIEHYEKYPMDERPPSYHHVGNKECPLCCVHIIGASATTCKDCPWTTIEGNICMDNRYMRASARERIARLNRWKKKIQGGI